MEIWCDTSNRVVLFLAALGITNITQGITEGNPVATSYVQVAVDVVTTLTDADSDIVHNSANILDYVLSLLSPDMGGGKLLEI